MSGKVMLIAGIVLGVWGVCNNFILNVDIPLSRNIWNVVIVVGMVLTGLIRMRSEKSSSDSEKSDDTTEP